MGINFVLFHYIPQHNAQIWDETSKTKTNFSILRNTDLPVFESNFINDHATLPCFSTPGSVIIKYKKANYFQVAFLLFSELPYTNGIAIHGRENLSKTSCVSRGFHQFLFPPKPCPRSASST